MDRGAWQGTAHGDHYYILDGSTTKSCWVAQGSIFSILINHNGEEHEKEYTYIQMSHFAIQQKLNTAK